VVCGTDVWVHDTVMSVYCTVVSVYDAVMMYGVSCSMSGVCPWLVYYTAMSCALNSVYDTAMIGVYSMVWCVRMSSV